MSNKLKELRAKEGFTIIEVIIVLVIGAVIMLAVFLVVPQLQRTQRNSTRQNNARRVLTAIEQLKANGQPVSESNITGITGTITDPSGGTITWQTNADATTPAVLNKDRITTATNSAKCDTTNNNYATGGNGPAVVVVLEPFTTGTTPTGVGYCVTSGN